MLLNSSQYIPNDFKLRFDHCNRKQGIATFGVSSSSGNSNFLGSLAAITSSYFENYRFNDLSRSAENQYIATTSICFDLNLIECSGLKIMDTLIVKSHLFILTSKGLFVSQKFLSATNNTSSAVYHQIFPRLDDLDYTTSSVLTSVRIFGKSDCLDTSHNFVFLMFSSTLMYTTVEEIGSSLNPDWTTVGVDMISGADNSTVFFNALRDVLNQKNIYLVGTPLIGNDQIICSANSSCSPMILLFQGWSYILRQIIFLFMAHKYFIVNNM